MSFEEEPFLELTIHGEKVVAHRKNSAVFTFIGELSCFDHVYIGGEDEQTGHYIFNSAKAYPDIANFMDEHNYPMHLNSADVASCDQEAFEMTHYGDIRASDFPPKGWTPDGTAR